MRKGCHLFVELGVLFGLVNGPRTQARNSHVILISIDGLGAFQLETPILELPNIRALAKEGVQAEGSLTMLPRATQPLSSTLPPGRTSSREFAMSRTTPRGWLFILLLSFAPTVLCHGQSEGRKSYEVLKTLNPIVIDGRLDDTAWQSIPDVGPFQNNADGSPSPLRTEAKLTYNDDFLYFAFRCWDTNIWSTFRTRDEHLWTEEVVEVFLQADPDQSSYIELEVNPLGTLLDIFLLDIRKPLRYESWNSHGIQWSVEVQGTVDGMPGDRFWTCEIALPMADIIPAPNIPPEVGDRWRLNLYRVEKKPQPAGLAWSPTGKPDFHVPSQFGEIIFGDKTVR